ncbi:MAG: hypothetical protein WEB93_02770 [Sphingomonadales bacterium]
MTDVAVSPIDGPDGPAVDEVGTMSPFDDIDLTARNRGASDSVHIFVSLYLILIAFFMVLDSISHQEVIRAEAVMDSVSDSFRKVHLPRVGVIDL